MNTKYLCKNLLITLFSLIVITSFWLTSGLTEYQSKKILETNVEDEIGHNGSTVPMIKTVLEDIPASETFVIPTNVSTRNNVIFNNSINERVFILRLDDVQAFVWNDVTTRIIDTVIERNMSISLGVIPLDLNDDKDLTNYLRSVSKNGRVEIAQHGINHTLGELDNFDKYDEGEIVKEVSRGTEQIVKATGIYPVTMIPPNNDISNGGALKQLGFRIISGDYKLFYQEDGIMNIGYTVTTSDNYSTNIILDSCKEEFRNVCVILIHPQDYVKQDGSIDNEKFNGFIEMVNGLGNSDMKSITFSDLLEQEFVEGSAYYKEKFQSSLYESQEYYHEFGGGSYAFGTSDCGRLKTLKSMLPSGEEKQDKRINYLMETIAWDYKYYTVDDMWNYCIRSNYNMSS